jgi:hypothetical protein
MLCRVTNAGDSTINICDSRRTTGLFANSSVSELHFKYALSMARIVRNWPRPQVRHLRARRLWYHKASASVVRFVASPMVGRFYRGAITRHS